MENKAQLRDDGYTLEELCRTIWQADPKGYMQLGWGYLQTLREQFEREDAERATKARRETRQN